MGCPLARVPPTYGSTPRGECWTLLRREVALLVPPGQTRVLEAADHINKLAVRAARFLERHDEEAGNAWWLASLPWTLCVAWYKSLVLDMGLCVKPFLVVESGLLEIKTLFFLKDALLK